LAAGEIVVRDLETRSDRRVALPAPGDRLATTLVEAVG